MSVIAILRQLALRQTGNTLSSVCLLMVLCSRCGEESRRWQLRGSP